MNARNPWAYSCDKTPFKAFKGETHRNFQENSIFRAIYAVFQIVHLRYLRIGGLHPKSAGKTGNVSAYDVTRMIARQTKINTHYPRFRTIFFHQRPFDDMSPFADDLVWARVNYRALTCRLSRLHSVQFKTSVEVHYQPIGSFTNSRNELVGLFCLTVVILCCVSSRVGVE